MTNAADIIEGIRELRPRIREAADEIERHGTLPHDLYDALAATGYLRMTVPRRLGGGGLTLEETNAVICEAAHADSSVGWLAMIAMHVPVILSLLGAEAFDQLFEDGPDLRARVVLAPRGKAVAVDGGWAVSGRWPFASGGPSPRFVAGACMVEAAADVEPRGGDAPRLLVLVMETAEVEFLDTWHSVGLRGTNSCDFVATEVFVASSRAAELFGGRSCLDGPLGKVPFRLAVTPGHLAVALGIARAARDEVESLAATKRSIMNPGLVLGADPLFQQAFGELSMHIEAAEALLGRTTASIWGAAETNRPLDRRVALAAIAAGPYGTGLCVRAVDAAYSLGGSASLYDDSPLQRRLRDVHVATQHVGVSVAAYRAIGASLGHDD